MCVPAPGSKLLEASLCECEGDDVIRQALLHVHTANTEAMDWYQHRGFKVGDLLQALAGRLFQHYHYAGKQAGRHEESSSISLTEVEARGYGFVLSSTAADSPIHSTW